MSAKQELVMKMFLKTLGLFLIALLLCGCDIPNFFWEQEARKVVDDVVDEEEKPKKCTEL